MASLMVLPNEDRLSFERDNSIVSSRCDNFFGSYRNNYEFDHIDPRRS